MFCLVDGNNFYVSCERVFNPSLRRRPVIVTSNNGGCIVSRSNEAKAIGLRMGEPVFKCRRLIELHRVRVLPANMALYGDMSDRMMKLLSQWSSDYEVYSIDECFLSLSEQEKDYHSLGKEIQATIQQQLGLPVGVGFGRSKTLAKCANALSKRVGVMNIHDYDEDKVLKTIDISSIWGVGKAFSFRLRAKGIRTAYDVKYASLFVLKSICHRYGVLLKHELEGIPVIALSTEKSGNKSIVRSRSFGRDISNKDEIKREVAVNIEKATRKLRRQKQKVKSLQVFLLENRYKIKMYKSSIDIELPVYSSATPYVLGFVLKAVDQIYKESKHYVKSGIILSDLKGEEFIPRQLLDQKDEEKQEKLDRLMKVCDEVQSKWGTRLWCGSSYCSQESVC
ncbi:hypothetical protein DID78_01985 [Candidatus Marinamargulisbacteria bacterium SCGC AG-343-D04]|nr:hypothetical protein DID78_01985 [Candidatus Marinamargulisbacteria bacterium SCGC AG-343-D04]